MRSSSAKLGLGKLKVLHSLSYFLGIGLPGVLFFGSWLSMKSLEEALPVFYFSFVLVLVSFLFEAYYSDFKYMDCPCCGEYIRVRADWECGDCGVRQGQERLLIEPCRHCGGTIETISCKECGEEMDL